MAKEKTPIQELVAGIEKQFGHGSARTMDSLPPHNIREWVSTSSAVLNKTIGSAGFPVGKLTNITGKPQAGKTTLISHAMAEVQKEGGIAVLIDTEWSYDPERATAIGIDPESLVMISPDDKEVGLSVEDVFVRIDSLLKASIEQDTKMLIAWDSIGGTPSGSEEAVEMTESGGMGAHARTISKGLRKITPLLGKSRAALLVVSQIKSKIGGYGTPETYLAKDPLDFHSSLIVRVSQCGKIELGKDKEIVGIVSRFKVNKSKFSFPFKMCEIDNMFLNGFDDSGALLTAAVEAGSVIRNGAWYVCGETKFQRGKWKEMLEQDEELKKSIVESL